MLPPPASAIAAPIRAASRAGAVKFTASVASQAPRDRSKTVSGYVIPALLTRMSSPPKAARASAASDSTAAGEPRSAVSTAVRTPWVLVIVSACSASCAAARPCRTTSAPAAARASATAAPMPRDAPVTRARRPARSSPAATVRLLRGEKGLGGRHVGDELVEVAGAGAGGDGRHLPGAAGDGDVGRDAAQQVGA